MAGKGVRDYKRRIRSVKNTQQITKAMKMVSAAKLRRAQEKAEESRPYTSKLHEVLARLTTMVEDAQHPLLEKHESVRRVTYVVVTADRGLCGAFNTNIIRKANASMNEETRQVESNVVAVGRKARDFYRKREINMAGDFVNLGDKLGYSQAKEIGQFIMKMYEEEATDEVYLVYAKFINAMRQIPTMVQILPIVPPEEDKSEATELSKYMPDYLYEPSVDTILLSLLPRYIENEVYHALLESKASEHGARMAAMGAATDNAKELIGKLNLEMNKARQAAITKEILEIVGGAEALKKGGK
ncbi:MAG: ATP synthase F1 subunit gamma [Solirubrobacterales bacterium]